MSNSFLLKTCFVTLTMLCLVRGSQADEPYPSRAIRVIVPYAAGGPGDIISRGYASELANVLGKTVIVENKPGAGTAIGTQTANQAPADGYTLLFATDGIVSTMLSLKNPGYSMDDFIPVAMLGDQYYVFMTPTAIPPKDLKAFVEYARLNSAKMSYGTLGPGSASHVLGDRFAREGKFSWRDVAYRGATPAIQALMSNEVQGYFTTQSSAVALKDSDKIRALAFAAEERGPFLPELPTFKELGYSTVVDKNWYVILIRTATPNAIVDRLRKASEEVMRSPAMRQHQKTLSLSPARLPMERFPAAVAESVRTKSEDLKRLGISPQ